MSQVAALTKVGVFHFGSDDKSDPIRSLTDSLVKVSRHENLESCLIVTPEAFNIRYGYFASARTVDFSIGASLASISAGFGVAFVAGLIDEEGGYSCAYLIDGDILRLLTRKVEDDGSRNYYCSDICDSPCFHRGICIGALICMDAGDFNVRKLSNRYASFLRSFDSWFPAQTVLAIPAHFMSYASEAVAMSWTPDIAVILANSSPRQPSVIRIGEETSSFSEATNAICIKPLAKPDPKIDASAKS